MIGWWVMREGVEGVGGGDCWIIRLLMGDDLKGREQEKDREWVGVVDEMRDASMRRWCDQSSFSVLRACM